MAKVKDRLIFEGKKMEAFESRKSNREQKLRSKEKHAHRIAEKSKAKKQHLRDVEDWAQSAASNRVGGGRVRDDDNDYLNSMNKGPNKGRMAADKKFGFGGKRGRFKQHDNNDDMSGYNPKGNFSGGKKATGNKRKGKRARDASKSRR
jgi:rRNA-processing protein EBP2